MPYNYGTRGPSNSDMKTYFPAKIIIFASLLLIVWIAVLNVFYPNDHPNRYLAIYSQALLLGISLVFVLITFISSGIQKTGVHYSLLFFIMMLSLYGLFSPQIDKLPIMLYASISFFLFYYATYEGYLQHNRIHNMAIILMIIYAYETYIGIDERSQMRGLLFAIPDNIGYNTLMVIPIFALNIKNTKNIFLISVAFLLVELSFKRGAMLIGAVVLILAFVQIVIGEKNVFNNSEANKAKAKLAAFVLSAILIYGAIEYFDILIFRFLVDPTGSGRINFYASIYEGWLNAHWINQLIGFGFFEVPEYLRKIYGVAIYAHSDWLELLYDHGILGITLYSILLITHFMKMKDVKLYSPNLYLSYLMVLSIWFMRSLVSGVYINKDSIVLFLTVGFILGTTYKNKNNLPAN